MTPEERRYRKARHAALIGDKAAEAIQTPDRTYQPEPPPRIVRIDVWAGLRWRGERAA